MRVVACHSGVSRSMLGREYIGSNMGLARSTVFIKCSITVSTVIATAVLYISAVVEPGGTGLLKRFNGCCTLPVVMVQSRWGGGRWGADVTPVPSFIPSLWVLGGVGACTVSVVCSARCCGR